MRRSSFYNRLSVFSLVCLICASVLQAQEGGDAGTAMEGSSLSGEVGYQGAFSYGIPIITPPARGVGPSVALSYGPGSNGDLAGYGWNVPMAAITRNTRYGVDQIYSRPEFMAPGAGELLRVTNNSLLCFGFAGVEPVPADYDGDGIADIAVFDPAEYVWHIYKSSDGLCTLPWGYGDYQTVSGDFDGDGLFDVGGYVASNGTWSISLSSGGTGGNQFGYADAAPAEADYDGDGTTDIAVYDAGAGTMQIYGSSIGFYSFPFIHKNKTVVSDNYIGSAGSADEVAFYNASDGEWTVYESLPDYNDISYGQTGANPFLADLDGDGIDDKGVYKISKQRLWWSGSSAGGQYFSFENNSLGSHFLFGDFNGNGQDGCAIYSNGTWSVFPKIPRWRHWGYTGPKAFTKNFGRDGRTDLALRTSGGYWHVHYAEGNTFGIQWGTSDSTPVPGDYDGDGKTDIAEYRAVAGEWKIRYSSGGSTTVTHGWGAAKAVPGDYNNDGRFDYAVYYPPTGAWIIKYSNTGQQTTMYWGYEGPKPVPGDYDGDGYYDFAVYAQSDGHWLIRYHNGNTADINYGWSAANPVQDDYDGDGKTDIAVYNPSVGDLNIRRSSSGAFTFPMRYRDGEPTAGDFDGDGKNGVSFFQWGYWHQFDALPFQVRNLGGADYQPFVGDFDNDGRDDIGVYRAQNGAWRIRRSSNGQYLTYSFGYSGTEAVPADYDGDGQTDYALYIPQYGVWTIRGSSCGTTNYTWGYGGVTPYPDDYDHDGKADCAVFNPDGRGLSILGSSVGAQSYTLTGSSGSGDGLNAAYYNNIDLSGLKLERVDSRVCFNWGSGSPDSSIGSDTFSVRWSGYVEPEFSETYTFYTATDDGVRLWVDGKLLINKWQNQCKEWSGTIALKAGRRYSIQMEYYENTGGAIAYLKWSSPSRSRQVIPQSRLYTHCPRPLAGDLSGNGQNQLVIFDDTDWTIFNRFPKYRKNNYGYSETSPLHADFDGDGRADCAVYHPETGIWNISCSSGDILQKRWGRGNIVPIAADFDGDGIDDIAAYDRDTAAWMYSGSSSGDKGCYLEYRPKYEAAFQKYLYNVANDSWVTYDANGTRYDYGDTFDTCMANPDNINQVFGWYLRQVTDIHGNYATYHYFHDAGSIYPKEIRYTGHGDDPGDMSVRFEPFYSGVTSSDIRPDITTVYSLGFPVQRRYRLEEIKSYADDDLVTKHVLSYCTGNNFTRSLLDHVTRYGSDGTTTLPAVNFEYTQTNVRTNQQETLLANYTLPSGLTFLDDLVGSPNNHNPESTGAQFGDVNGDGLVDLLYSCAVPGGFASFPHDGTYIWLNTGNGWSTPHISKNGSSIQGTWKFPSHTDLDGRETITFINNLDDNLGQTNYTPDATGVQVVDLNNDGRVDLLVAQEHMTIDRPDTNNFRTAYINNGVNGWVQNNNWALPKGYPLMASVCQYDYRKTISTGAQMPDLNGDGLPDYVYSITSGAQGVSLSMGGVKFDSKTWINTGNGWREDNRWRLPDGYFLMNTMDNIDGIMPSDGALRFADLNADGLVDLIYANGTTNAYHGGIAQANTKHVWLNTGSGWEQHDEWNLPNLSGSNSINAFVIDDVATRNSGTASRPDPTGLRFNDLNGDGLVDIEISRVFTTSAMNSAARVIQRMAWMNTGNGWDNWYIMTPGDYSSAYRIDPTVQYSNTVCDSGVRWIDLDGNGIKEYVVARAASLAGGYMPAESKVLSAFSAENGANDKMVKINNGKGGTLQVKYKPAVHTENYQCPHPMGVISEKIASDGLGHSYTTRYDYADGWFYTDSSDPHKNEFRGFHRQTVIGSAGASNVTYYHQGGGINGSAKGESADHEVLKGTPCRTEVYGNNGSLYASTISKFSVVTYNDTVSGQARYWKKSTRDIAFAFEGLTSTHLATASETYWDNASGLVTGSASFGYVNADPNTGAISSILPGDELYTFTEYASFSSPYLRGRRSRALVTADAAGSQKLGETLISYTPSGLPLTTRTWLDQGNTYVTNGWILEYDQYGHAVRSRDQIGVETVITYDNTYHMFPVQENSGGFITTQTFDPRSGAVLSGTDPVGVVASNAYDVFFRPVKSWVDGIWQSEMHYTQNGCANGIPRNILHSRQNGGSTVGNIIDSYAYIDGMGRTIQTRAESERGDGTYRIASRVFDETGRITYEYEPYIETGSAFAAFNPQNPAVEYTYDPLGRLIQSTPRTGDADSPTAPTHVAFRDGNTLGVTVSTDAMGNRHKTYSDAFGRTTKVQDIVNGHPVTTRYSYDKMGNMTNTVDPEGNTIQLFYNSLGYKLRMIDPDMGQWIYQYDYAGRMTNQIDSKNQRVAFSFDGLGRMHEKRTYNASGTLTETVNWHYDSSDDPAFTVYTGQLYKVTQSQATNRFSYTTHGLLTKAELTIAGQGTFTSSNTYDEMDRLLTATYPNNVAAIQYNYGPIGNLESVSSLYGLGETNITFYQVDEINDIGQVARVTYGNNVESTFAYYPLSHRARQTLTRKIGGSAIQSMNYKYNQGGLITDITDNIRTGRQSATYANITYDSMYRLTALDRYDPVAQDNSTFHFSYDTLGNITRNDDLDSAAAYTYNDSRPHALSSIGTNRTYQYDACGNITNAAGKTYQYDARNRLARVIATDGATTEFKYLDSGARYLKTTVTAEGTTNTTFYLGQSMEIENDDILCHVFFGGKRIASFTPINEQQQASNTIIDWMDRLFGFDDASRRWTQTKNAYPGGPLFQYVIRKPFDFTRIYAFLKSGMIVALLLLLLRIMYQPRKTRRNTKMQITEFLRSSNLLHVPSCSSWFTKGTAWIVILSLLSMSFPEVANAQCIFPRGDVNGDGIVDVTDAMLIRQVVQGTRRSDSPIFAAGYMNGDVNYDGATNATDAKIIAQYVTGSRSLPTAPGQTQKVIFYHSDHLGGANIITDMNGNIVQHIQYTPYGEISYELNLGVSINYLYTGQEFDRETGLYYYNARYYDPEIGRFIQPDTIIPDPGDSQAYNRYSYCRNNPITYTDPSGHEHEEADAVRQQWRDDGLLQDEDGNPIEIPRLAGMEDDDLVRTLWLDEYIRTGQINPGLADDMAKYGMSSVGDMVNYYIEDKNDDQTDDGMVLASQIVGAACAAIGSCFGPIGTIVGSAVGSMAATYMTGGSTSDILYSGMVGAVTGACIAYGGPAGPAVGGAFSGVAYSARYGGNMWDAAWKGAVISQVGAYFGTKAKAYGFGNVGQSTAAGATSGAAGAALNGGDIGKAMLRSAAIGAVTAVAVQSVKGNSPPTGGKKDQTSWFKPKGEKFCMGRDGMPLFNPKNPLMNMIENIFPGAHEFAQMHDTFVGGMPKTGIGFVDVVIDLVINIPSMPPAYVASVVDNTLNTVFR